MVVVEQAEEWEDDEKPPQPAAGELLKIPGSIVSIAERLDDELTRSLQHIDPHTGEYIERLSDEQALYSNILRGLLYIEDLQKNDKLETPQDGANRMVMRRLEHIYFKVLPGRAAQYLAQLTRAIAITSRCNPRGNGLEVYSSATRLENHSSQRCQRYRDPRPDTKYLPLRQQRRHHPCTSVPLPGVLFCPARPILPCS